MKDLNVPYSINGFFEKNKDGTINIKTSKYGTLKGLPVNILPDDFQGKDSGEVVVSFSDYNFIAKKVFNELLKTDENE